MSFKIRKVTELIGLENNPRTITGTDFETLCVSIRENQDYFKARPLILSDRTGELVVLAGNQRLRAAIHLKIGSVPTYLMRGLTIEKENEIIIRDNVSNGKWDFDILANMWDKDQLEEWGVPVYFPVEEDMDLKFENEPEDLAPNTKIILEYNQSEYDFIIKAFERIGGTKEQVVFNLLNV